MQAFLSDFDQQVIETQKPVENGETVQVELVNKSVCIEEWSFLYYTFPAYTTERAIFQDT